MPFYCTEIKIFIYRSIADIIKHSKKIALFSHSNPDPDTIGSTLALYEALVELKKDEIKQDIKETYDKLKILWYFNDNLKVFVSESNTS